VEGKRARWQMISIVLVIFQYNVITIAI